jgi:hypothetical protein
VAAVRPIIFGGKKLAKQFDLMQADAGTNLSEK